MARFYATIRGSRGQASRLGTPNSGLRGHIRGWNVGADVELMAHGKLDTVDIQVTNGSRGDSGSRKRQTIAIVREREGARPLITLYDAKGETVAEYEL